jgi:hypothetical protein
MEKTIYQTWAELKKLEAEAKQARLDFEDSVLREHMSEIDFNSGKTFTIGEFKIATRVNYKIEQDKVPSILKELGDKNPFNVKYSVSKTKLKEIEDAHLLNILSEVVSEEPGRPTFSLKTK